VSLQFVAIGSLWLWLMMAALTPSYQITVGKIV
jgi:hypothetical protein